MSPGEKNLIATLVKSLLVMASHMPAAEFRAALLGGVLANTLGSLPDNYFETLLANQPCGRPGCDCHCMFDELKPGLIKLRNDIKQHRPGGLMAN